MLENLYAFQLGREKELCLAELVVVLGKENLVEKNFDTAVFQLKEDTLANKNPQELQNKLGGTIKIMQIFEEIPGKINLPKILKSLEKHLPLKLQTKTGKIPFAISVLSFKNPRLINIRPLLNFCKKILKSLNKNSRFVNKDFAPPKPSTIYKAKVLQKGIDLNIIQGTRSIFLAESIAIQDIDSYSKRDYDKPRRDAKIGMIPPKLAQIMINLAEPCRNIFDPFCGTGTILLEGMLMEKTVVGSDISPRLIEYSQMNCQWLATQWRLQKSSFRNFVYDARLLNKSALPERIDAIITEGYLGNPVLKLPSQIEREETFREFANLHLNWLSKVHEITPPNLRIVMCLAAFNHKGQIEHFPRFEELATTAGFKVKSRFTYGREDQIVIRDIIILEKKTLK